MNERQTTIVSTDRDRALYNKYSNEFKGKIVVPSYLRIEQKLLSSKSQYEFNVLKTGNEETTEVKLNQNDTFIITRLGFFLLSKETAKAGKGTLQTYPNPAQFVLGGATFVDARELETIYNGYLNIKIATVTYLDYYPMINFRNVPVSQEGRYVTGFLNALAADTERAMPDSDISSYKGYVELTPQVKLSGRVTNEVKVNIPSYTGMILTQDFAGYDNVLVFMPQGFLVKDGALQTELAKRS